MTAGEVLAEAIEEVHVSLERGQVPSHVLDDAGPPLALAGELVERLRAEGLPEGNRPGPRLVAETGEDPGRRRALADVLALTIHRLAPSLDAPVEGARAAAWQAVLEALDELYGVRVERFESLPFVGPRLLAALKDEALDRLPPLPAGGGPVFADPGPALAALAVSRQLRVEISTSVGRQSAPTYSSFYQRQGPGSGHPPHIDKGDYELIFLLTLDHTIPPAVAPGAALRVYRPGAREPERLFTGPGGALLLSRGTVHARERLSAGERRLLLGIGFAEAPAIS